MPAMARKNAPTVAQIVSANQAILGRCPNMDDGRDPTRHCWACGGGASSDVAKRTFKAHVIAHRNGGADLDPKNYFLLCKECHEVQPDGLQRSAQERWLFSRPSEVSLWIDRLRPTLERVVQRVEQSGVPPEDVAGYMRSNTFKLKIKGAIQFPKAIPATLEALIYDYLSDPTHPRQLELMWLSGA